MIRLALHSEDRALQPLLSSALGTDFQVVLGSTENEINRMVILSACDVIVLDLVLPDVMVGITEASITRSRSMPMISV